jgi:hypothetical protein
MRLTIAAILLAAAPVRGGSPDIVPTDVMQIVRHGVVEGTVAYSVGVDLCNLGTASLDWVADTASHPVMAAALLRLEDGRLEQLGASWAWHASVLDPAALCESTCDAPVIDALPPGCGHRVTADEAGLQFQLGPRHQVNPVTGAFAFPWQGSVPPPAPAIGRRLQIATSDLDPQRHAGAAYFVQVSVVSSDDALPENNTMVQPVEVLAIEGEFHLEPIGPAIDDSILSVWSDLDPDVELQWINIPNDGIVGIASRATSSGPGMWRYEYTLHNLSSNRSIRGLSVPIPGITASAIGFRGDTPHSGSPLSSTPWAVTQFGGTLSWSTDEHMTDPDAAALRWGDVFTLWFDAPAPPQPRSAELAFFEPGQSTTTTIIISGPQQTTGATALHLFGPPTTDIGDVTQIDAVAELLDGSMANVTAQASWQIDPPDAGTISPSGEFTAGSVQSDTLAHITAEYLEQSNLVTGVHPIVIMDTGRIVVHLTSGIDVTDLSPGSSFEVDVALSTDNRPFDNIRMMQFDWSLSGGLTVTDWQWSLPVDPELYFVFEAGEVASATYTGIGPLTGFIVDLDETPLSIANLSVMYDAPGRLSVRGTVPAATVDSGARLVTGFELINVLTPGNDRLRNGVMATASLANVEVVGSIPESGAIDARQPTPPEQPDTLQGFDAVTLEFDSSVDGLTVADFSVIATSHPWPELIDVAVDGATAALQFDRPIQPGAWTTVQHLPSNNTVTFGALPGDVSADAASGPLDILALVDALNGVQDLAEWSTDIDRSTVTAPADVLRLIDLLNGAGTWQPWNGQTLPPLD